MSSEAIAKREAMPVRGREKARIGINIDNKNREMKDINSKIENKRGRDNEKVRGKKKRSKKWREIRRETLKLEREIKK